MLQCAATSLRTLRASSARSCAPVVFRTWFSCKCTAAEPLWWACTQTGPQLLAHEARRAVQAPPLEAVMRKMYPASRGPLSAVPASGPAPALMRFDEWARVRIGPFQL